MDNKNDKPGTPLTEETAVTFLVGYFVVVPLLMLCLGLLAMAIKWIFT